MPPSRAPIPFGRYVLRERLAKGGMGEVFLAVAMGERGFEKPVVVKRVLPEHAARSELSDLFVEEAKLMTRLAHPNVVEVLDFGRGEGGDYFLVLEYVEGVDLGRLAARARARGEPFPIALALSIVTQALRGLHHAHTRAADEGAVLVHRDVSPSNVLLSVEGEVKVADFGVALRRRAGEHRPPSGVVGKPAYMAPEQYEGREIDPRADVFAVGVVLFELLTGSLPFEGDTEALRQDAARRGDFGRARDIRADVTPALDAILRRALAPTPEVRFPDARVMARALAECGLPVAESDDIADAVRAALASPRAPGRRVIALSADRLHDAADDDGAPRELTRTGSADGAAAFTLRVMDEPARLTPATSTPEDRSAPTKLEDPRLREPTRTPINEASAPPRAFTPAPRDAREGIAPPQSARRLWFGAAIGGAAIAIVFAVRFAASSSGEDRGPSPSASASAPAPTPNPPPTDTNTIEVAPQPPPSAPPSPVSSARSGPRPPSSSAPTATAPTTAPTAIVEPPPPSAASAKPAAPSSQPPEDCVGAVKIASIGSFTVSGGPSVVQSPGVYSWRCGSYALSAVSRADPSQKKAASVVVRAGATSTVDLR